MAPVSKPWLSSLVVVTATANLKAALPFLETWTTRASFDWTLVVVVNGETDQPEVRPSAGRVGIVRNAEFLGSVPAFLKGIRAASTIAPEAIVIAALHDDLEILEDGWDAKVMTAFTSQKVGLAGFSGALGLGAQDIYRTPYSPHQLARQDFRSNLRDAELHGIRKTVPEQVACCDGFSLIGRAKWWWEGLGPAKNGTRGHVIPPWDYLTGLGVKHHAYDSWMGMLAARAGYETWYIPVACHHAGGRTAVANANYSAWANLQGGDGHFWNDAHRLCYEDGRGLLPLRV